MSKSNRSESQFAKFLDFDGITYGKLVGDLFNGMEPATRAHVLVAYENLIPFLSALWSAAKEQGEDFTVEHFIHMAAERLEVVGGDEINSRRWGWFLFAALLGRLEKLSRNNSELSEIGAHIWCSIALDAHFLKVLLPNNVVWKKEEKEWFDLSASDENMTQWVVNNAMPSVFSKLDSVRQFSESVGFLYYPSEREIFRIP